MGLGAIIGAGASIIGSIAGGNNNSDAIKDASKAQSKANKQAVALQRDIYNQNVAIQTPLYNTGIAAGNQMNALLGLPQMTAATFAPVGTSTTSSTSNRPTVQSTGFMEKFLPGITSVFDSAMPQTATPAPTAPTPTVPTQTPQQTAQAAYDTFKNYTGYTSRLNEANNALNGAYAARGTLQSGAAMQAMARMNQDYASNEFGNYMGYLGGQQQLASGAANALSGVGTNYANNAGNLAIQNGNNIANAAIAQANNQNAMWGGISGALGGLASSYMR